MAYIGNSPTNIVRGRRAVYEYTATAGQTVFTGVDNNGLSLDLLEANENDVYLNGSRLVLNDDYTVLGDTLTLLSAAALNDILIIVTQDEIANASSYTKAESDSRYINYNGDIVNGNLQVVGNVSIGDNNTFNVGGSNDLQIFHDGTHTYIDEINPTGYLFIRGANIQLLNPSNDIHLEAVSNGSVDLYYDNAKKFATTSTGIDVTGRVNTVGITSNDNSHIFTSPSYNIIDFISDNNDDGSNDDIIVNFKNGSAGTVKAELRWDESSDTFEISRADNRGDLVLAANGNVGIGTSNPSNKLSSGRALVISGSGNTNTTPSVIRMNGRDATDGAGFVHTEVYGISGVTSATEISRITGTGSNGFNMYIEVKVTGHTGTQGNGLSVGQYMWQGNTQQVQTLSLVNSGNNVDPSVTFDTTTSNVCIVYLTSSDGSNGFNGVMEVKYYVPIDFAGNTWTTS